MYSLYQQHFGPDERTKEILGEGSISICTTTLSRIDNSHWWITGKNSLMVPKDAFTCMCILVNHRKWFIKLKMVSRMEIFTYPFSGGCMDLVARHVTLHFFKIGHAISQSYHYLFVPCYLVIEFFTNTTSEFYVQSLLNIPLKYISTLKKVCMHPKFVTETTQRIMKLPQ